MNFAKESFVIFGCDKHEIMRIETLATINPMHQPAMLMGLGAMKDENVSDYYKRRAEQADALASRSIDHHIKHIHLAMARDYRAMSEKENPKSTATHGDLAKAPSAT